MKNFILFLKGILMGIANIIPGVSGGTLAVSLNIFDELISSINNLFKDWKKSLSFLIPIFLGIGFGILAFSSLVEYGLTNYAFTTSMFFVGLIVGSIPLIYSKAIEKGSSFTDYILAVIVFFGLVFLSIKEANSPEQQRVAVEIGSFDIMFVIKYFFIGMVASSAMIIPGISGSFLLILLGAYNTIIFSITNLIVFLKDTSNTTILLNSLYVLVPAGIGIVFGIFFVSKIIGILLEKAHTKLYFVVLGLIFGSIFSIFYNPDTYSTGFDLYGILCGVALMVFGLFISKKLGAK